MRGRLEGVITGVSAGLPQHGDAPASADASKPRSPTPMLDRAAGNRCLSSGATPQRGWHRRVSPVEVKELRNLPEFSLRRAEAVRIYLPSRMGDPRNDRESRPASAGVALKQEGGLGPSGRHVVAVSTRGIFCCCRAADGHLLEPAGLRVRPALSGLAVPAIEGAGRFRSPASGTGPRSSRPTRQSRRTRSKQNLSRVWPLAAPRSRMRGS